MKIICLAVGKKHEPEFAAAIQKYQDRLSVYLTFEFEYIPATTITRESETILKRCKDEDIVVLLDETGVLCDNKQLARSLEGWQNKAVKRLVIIIGGAYGVDNTVMQRSNQVISLSKLVFPHQLVRLLLVEQLYRSFNLLAGRKYHHD